MGIKEHKVREQKHEHQVKHRIRKPGAWVSGKNAMHGNPAVEFRRHTRY